MKDKGLTSASKAEQLRAMEDFVGYAAPEPNPALVRESSSFLPADYWVEQQWDYLRRRVINELYGSPICETWHWTAHRENYEPLGVFLHRWVSALPGKSKEDVLKELTELVELVSRESYNAGVHEDAFNLWHDVNAQER